MALIKCPECNKEFSDQAKCCPNCGFPTDEILKNISAERVKKHSGMMKKMLLILLAIIGIMAVVFIVCFIKNQPDKNGYYEGLTWDTTYDEVKKKYPDIKEMNALDKADKTYNTTVSPFLNMEGVEANIAFSFVDDKLFQVYIIIFENDINGITVDELTENLNKKFDSLYGVGEDSGFTEAKMREWKTEKSKIDVFVISNTVAISYQDITAGD